jgi:hypothetical protein
MVWQFSASGAPAWIAGSSPAMTNKNSFPRRDCARVMPTASIKNIAAPDRRQTLPAVGAGSVTISAAQGRKSFVIASVSEAIQFCILVSGLLRRCRSSQ